ncbi:uncharacterized protein LOC124168384 [Ischnura elegans]|uniref:uncharacterized protein LOC124168384 n=1 Tax=Ischnura elegans TaxID=197161 RepID=UPI001ED89FC7|nr:uncharacterized protein LOC124168384 [Ischnura elegans]
MTLSLPRSLSPRNIIDNGSDSLSEKSPKKFRSTNSWLETKKIQNALEERKVMLEEKRVEKLAQLSQGEWIPSAHVVKVIKKVGRHWAVMGHTYMGELYLDPEEALFLLEANTMEIYFNGLPMSLQQAYSILLGSESGCTLEEYRAFSHLTRFGYKVRRHRPEVAGKRRREEPLEIDVVGVICRNRSSDAGSSRRVVEVEDAVEVVDSAKANKGVSVEEIPLPPSLPPPSTSKISNEQQGDDDDIKFLEIVDNSKKRKVLSSVVIHDDMEISVTFNDNENNTSSAQGSNASQSDAQKKEGENLETEKTSAISIQPVSDCELVEDSTNESRPTRGIYRRNLFSSAASSSKGSESSTSVNTPSVSHNGCRSKRSSGPRNEKTGAANTSSSSDEIIVLSDDESKGDGRQAKELLKSNKEISLIELIDISEDDGEGKAVNRKNESANASKTNEKFDFWGVLGRIPTLESGRLIMKIPAPPSQLIPVNIQPTKDEYVVNVATSLQPPTEDDNSTPRQQGSDRTGLQGEENKSHESGGVSTNGETRAPQHHHHERNSYGSSNRVSQHYRHWSSSQGDSRSTYSQSIPQSSQGSNPHYWQQSLNTNVWNPWVNQSSVVNQFSNSAMAMNCWSGQYQANNGRPLWSSLVYSERQASSYPVASQQWTASSVTHFQHSAQAAGYQNYSQNSYSHYWPGNRSNQQQDSSSSSYSSRSTGRWQHHSRPWQRRSGRRHYNRGSRHFIPVRRSPPREDNVAEDVFTPSCIPKVPHARNWLELKIKSERTNPGEPELQQTVVQPKMETFQEDRKDIIPLLKPSDSINLGAVQSKLQITSSGKDYYYNGPNNYQSSLAIKFDLYMPNSNFRKSCPGLPKYRLSIVKSDDRIPKLKDNWYLTKDLNDEVPLLFAVSFTESVNFFSFSNVELPAPLSQ